MIETTRRGFLVAMGAAMAGAIVVPELVLEPRRRFWQVGRNAPVGYLQRIGSTTLGDTGAYFGIDATPPLWSGMRLNGADIGAPSFRGVSAQQHIAEHILVSPQHWKDLQDELEEHRFWSFTELHNA